MNKRTFLEAISISFLVTATVRISYGLENLYGLASINIIFAACTYFVLNNNYINIKNEKEKSNKEIKELIEKNTKRLDEIYSKMDRFTEIMNKNIDELKNSSEGIVSTIIKEFSIHNDNIDKVFYELKNEIKDKTNEINNNINTQSNINNEINDLFAQKLKADILLKKELKESMKNIQDTIIEGNNKTSLINSSILENNNKLDKIAKSIEEQLDKLIDIEGNLNELNDKSDDMLSDDQEIQDVLCEIKEENGRSNMNVIQKIDECIEANDKITSKYEIIQKYFTAELLKTASKNENVANMLKDNYKLLKEIVASV
ncbi:hypothetical protein OW763_16025 [Clostridium aestuarii]|uniref:Uncharacterized protein n=1 Tax=Clostridium aestuarii TaxID=338193 RepID=A0ABT4D3K7_9CLOT|nr:hypothetical protein [Clostridium aestuarii]MCY6485829.1 hypothetical protein [Clostridium aestuarii]